MKQSVKTSGGWTGLWLATAAIAGLGAGSPRHAGGAAGSWKQPGFFNDKLE